MGCWNAARWSVALLPGMVVFQVAQPPAIASGFAVNAQSASGMARSSAFTAQANDPSALFYNPAGISQLDRTSILLGTTLLRPHTDYEPTAVGSATSERERSYLLPHLYVTQPMGRRVSAGLGVYTPFGLSTRWPADWDGRFQVIDATIRMTTLSPVVAWQPSETLSVAAGIQYSYVSLAERRAINLAAFEGDVSLEGDARAIGYSAGVLVIPSPRWQFGASYRSRANAEVKSGWADFSVPGMFAAMFRDTPIHTEVTFPPSLRTGVLFRPSAEWTVEFDATWTGWSTIDELRIKFANGLPPDVTALGWRDSMAYSLGIEYRMTDHSRLRAGYLYDRTAIPDEKANPLIPDADRHGVSVGLGTFSERWTVDVGYQFLLFRRQKENDFGDRFSSAIPAIDASANGLYRSNAHVVSVSAGYRL